MENMEIIQQEEPLYSETELYHITKILCEALNPEHILLFGRLADGTPHSEITTYDLLVITTEHPRYDWVELRQFLKQHLSRRHRGLTGTNIYLYSQNYTPSSPSPFLFFAKTEGKLVYSRDPQLLKRPKSNFNFEEAYRNTAHYFATFFALGSNLLRDSSRCFEEYNLRQSALYVSQAMELFYRTLYYVYHGFEVERHDLVLLHQRMHTLSSDLNMLFNSDENRNGRQIYQINHYRMDAFTSVRFDVTKDELSLNITKIGRMKEIVEEVCKQRLELYKIRV